MTGPPDPLGALQGALREMQFALAQVDNDIRLAIERRNVLAASEKSLAAMIEMLTAELHFASPDSSADVVLPGLEGRPSVIVQVKQHRGGFDAATASTRDAITWVLDGADHPLEASEIVEAVDGLGLEVQPASVRSLLSKMAESGQIDRPSRGLYQRVQPGPGPAPVRLAGHLRRRDSDPRLTLPTLPTPEEFMALPPEPEDPDEPEPEFDLDPDYEEEDTRDYAS